LLNGRGDEAIHGPTRQTATNSIGKVLDHLQATLSVRYFRMELHPINFARAVGNSRIGGI